MAIYGALVKVKTLDSATFVFQLIPVSTPSLLPISSLIVTYIFCTCSDSTLSILRRLCSQCTFSSVYVLFKLHTTAFAYMYVQLVHHFSYPCPVRTHLSCPSPVSIPLFISMSNKYTITISQVLFQSVHHHILGILSAHIQYAIPPVRILYLCYPVQLVHSLSCPYPVRLATWCAGWTWTGEMVY